jgi:hypothetical protein
LDRTPRPHDAGALENVRTVLVANAGESPSIVFQDLHDVDLHIHDGKPRLPVVGVRLPVVDSFLQRESPPDTTLGLINCGALDPSETKDKAMASRKGMARSASKAAPRCVIPAGSRRLNLEGARPEVSVANVAAAAFRSSGAEASRVRSPAHGWRCTIEVLSIQ